MLGVGGYGNIVYLKRQVEVMQFDRPNLDIRIERNKVWHSWFAWKPVRTGPCKIVWLETVIRKSRYHDGGGWHWEYQAREKEK